MVLAHILAGPVCNRRSDDNVILAGSTATKRDLERGQERTK